MSSQEKIREREVELSEKYAGRILRRALPKIEGGETRLPLKAGPLGVFATNLEFTLLTMHNVENQTYHKVLQGLATQDIEAEIHVLQVLPGLADETNPLLVVTGLEGAKIWQPPASEDYFAHRLGPEPINC